MSTKMTKYYLAFHCYPSVAPDDYGTVDVVLSFGACERRRCTNVSIVDDAQLEETESLSVTLTRINQLDDRITLNPMDANIIITDNDGKMSLWWYDCMHTFSL